MNIANEESIREQAAEACQNTGEAIRNGINDIRSGRYDSAKRQFYRAITIFEATYLPDHRFADYYDRFKRFECNAALGQGLAEGIMMQGTSEDSYLEILTSSGHKDYYERAPNAYETPISITTHRVMGWAIAESTVEARNSCLDTIEHNMDSLMANKAPKPRYPIV